MTTAQSTKFPDIAGCWLRDKVEKCVLDINKSNMNN